MLKAVIFVFFSILFSYIGLFIGFYIDNQSNITGSVMSLMFFLIPSVYLIARMYFGDNDNK